MNYFTLYKKQIVIALIISLLSIPLLYGLWLISSRTQPEVVYDMKVLATDHITGNPQAKKVLIEYSDFQCPACAFFSAIINDLEKKHASDAAIIYRHFPLPQHPNSTRAAQASEAAGKQGKFWEMHDILFLKQKEWETNVKAEELFQSYAKSLKLDMEKYKADFASPELVKKIQDDYVSGNSYNIDATPTFFLNGKKLQNIRTLQDFERELNN